jgi:hypothetical protein
MLVKFTLVLEEIRDEPNVQDVVTPVILCQR